MANRTIEARLVISGEDKSASGVIDRVTKAAQQFAKDTSLSTAMRKNAEEAAKAEKAFNAVTKAMTGREGFAKAQADAKAAEVGLQQYTKALDAARQAKAAFGNVRPAKGSDEAASYAAATKALREATAAHQRAEREVTKTTVAMRAEASAMREADSAAARLGADLSNLVGHQAKVRAAFEASTAAISKQAAVEAQMNRAAASRQARYDAMKGAAGIVGIGAVHRAEHFAGHALHTYQHFDNERRFGKVVMDLSDEQQKPLVDQAIHMGAISRYNDVKVLHAQRELAARGLNRDQVLGMIPHVKDLGQALDIDIGEAAKQLESGIFMYKKDVSTLEAATRSAQQTADVQVKAAKISGMQPNDIQMAYKYGATPSRLAKVSEERMLAFAGVLKKAGIGGDESGVAFRALMSTANAPTAGAKVAMRAAGLDYNNYQKAPDKLALDPFVKQVAESYGVKLDAKARAGLGRIFSNKAIVGDSSKFTPAVMDFLSDALEGDDAKSKKSIAGLANRYRNASMQGVDSNRLIDDLLVKLRDNLAFANALFGSKQGGRIATALSDPETFLKMQKLLAPEKSAGYAARVSEARMEGFDGAVKRFQGAVTNLETKLGRAWDDDGKGGALTKVTDQAGKLIQHMAEMDNAYVRTASVVAAVGTAFVGLKSVGLLQSGFGLKSSAVALDSSAAALTAAAVKLGGGVPGGLPGASGAEPSKTKGGKLAGALKVGAGVAGAIALEPLAEEAQKRGIFTLPNLDDGLARAGLDFLDPNLGNKVLGDRAKAIPSMSLRPGEAPLTLYGSGLNSFGVNGPQSPEALAKRDADRYAKGLIDARRSAAPLNPGDELPGLGPEMATKAQEKGAEAGQRAGDGIKRGLQEKAPEVQEQGVGIMQRLQQLFSAGIFVPIHLRSGEGFGAGSGGGSGGGGGGIVNASYRPDGAGAFGGVRRSSGGGGAIPGRNAFGGVDPLAGGTAVASDGVARSGGSRSWRNNNPGNIEYGPFARSMGATGTDGRFARFPSYEAGRKAQEHLLFESRGYRNKTLPGAIRRWAPGSENNVPAYVRAMGTYDPSKRMQDYTPAERRQILDSMQRHEGWRPGRRSGGAVAATPSGDGDFFPNGAPRVLKPNSMPGAPGLTREQADRMRPMPTVPDAPPASTVGRGGSDLHGAIDRLALHVDRMSGARWHGQVDVNLTGSGRDQARVAALRTRATGPLSADLGVSMPGAKESDSDWA